MGRGGAAVCDEEMVGWDCFRECCLELGWLMTARHVCYWPAWGDDSADELADEVGTSMLVCISNDDADCMMSTAVMERASSRP